jgi:hypothetical protein
MIVINILVALIINDDDLDLLYLLLIILKLKGLGFNHFNILLDYLNFLFNYQCYFVILF